jgi:putative flavoprotein involved in K+ transport
MRTTVVIVGAGQAGLAISHCLTNRSIDHVLLERGSVANSWRAERWDSLRLLTPNWLTRLPGGGYRGPDAEGYMTATEVAAFLDAYADSTCAPVITEAEVTSIRSVAHGFDVRTSQGTWTCRAVVVAAGAASTASIPSLAECLPRWVQQISPIEYRNPAGIDSGPVLVVGASASGVQIADELQRAGRHVTLSVGDHVRVPRQYRGQDIHWWMDAIGLLDERIEEMDDAVRARALPSLQLIGTGERRDLDLNSLMDIGVVPVGRLVGLRDTDAQCSGSLANLVRAADLKQSRLLDRIDEFATVHGLDAAAAPTRVRSAQNIVDLRPVRTVVWATGFRPSWPWLDGELFHRVRGARGALRHDRGVVDVPGMFVLGLPFMRHRTSSFIDGVGADALALADEIADHLERRSGPRTK